MRIHKNMMLCAIIIGIISTLLMIIIEYNMYEVGYCYIVKFVPVIVGKKDFYLNIILSISTSSLILGITSFVNYNLERSKITKNIKLNYTLNCLYIKSIKVISNYENYIHNLELVEKCYKKQLELKDEFDPVFKNLKNNKLYKEMNDIVYQSKENTISKSVFDLNSLRSQKNKLINTHMLYDNLTQGDKVNKIYAKKIREIDQEVSCLEEKIVNEYLIKMDDIYKRIETINIKLNIEV